MKEEFKTVFEEFVDYLLPELTPSQVEIYIFLLRQVLNHDNNQTIRIGQRTMLNQLGKSNQSNKHSQAHIKGIMKSLEEMHCIEIGNVEREGTEYKVFLPNELTIVKEKMKTIIIEDSDEDYFTDQKKRENIFERDKWRCQYCGELLNKNNSTLDHFTPQTLGGKHNKENLRACCLLCNSIKSGKKYEEAAPLLLKSIQERRLKS